MGSSLIIAGLLGLGMTLLSIPLLVRLPNGLCDRATDWHHAQRPPVPRLGGLALVAAFLALESFIAFRHPEQRTLTPNGDRILLSSLAMFALGFWDDLRPLGPFKKLAGQVLIATLVCAGGVSIHVGSLPFTYATFPLGLGAAPVTVVWLVAFTNLINLIDGLDGLAGGISLMLMLLVAVMAHQNGHFELLAFGMAGALLGFLYSNFHPARVYLGDSGAYFLGFQIGVFSIVNARHGTDVAALAAPLFVLALAIADGCLTILRRGLRGLPLFRPDRRHLHHRLLAAGLSPRQAVLRLYGINLVFFFMGLAAFWSHGQWIPLLLAAAFLLLVLFGSPLARSRRRFAVHDPPGRARSPLRDAWASRTSAGRGLPSPPFGAGFLVPKQVQEKLEALRRVVAHALLMRRQTRYALALTRWLELESLRHSAPDSLWPKLIFAARKLGFASVKLNSPHAHRLWRHPLASALARSSRCEPHRASYGVLEFTGPACPLAASRAAPACTQPSLCPRGHGCCLADPRLLDTISELLAEAWTKSAALCARRAEHSSAEILQPLAPAPTPIPNVPLPSHCFQGARPVNTL